MSRALALALGLGFWLAAALLLWAGVETEIGVPGVDGARIANMSLMHQQALLMQAGIGATIIGAIFLAAVTPRVLLDREEVRARRGLASQKQICPICDEAVSAEASVCKWCDFDLVPASAGEKTANGDDVEA